MAYDPVLSQLAVNAADANDIDVAQSAEMTALPTLEDSSNNIYVVQTKWDADEDFVANGVSGTLNVVKFALGQETLYVDSSENYYRRNPHTGLLEAVATPSLTIDTIA